MGIAREHEPYLLFKKTPHAGHTAYQKPQTVPPPPFSPPPPPPPLTRSSLCRVCVCALEISPGTGGDHHSCTKSSSINSVNISRSFISAKRRFEAFSLHSPSFRHSILVIYIHTDESVFAEGIDQKRDPKFLTHRGTAWILPWGHTPS